MLAGLVLCAYFSVKGSDQLDMVVELKVQYSAHSVQLPCLADLSHLEDNLLAVNRMMYSLQCEFNAADLIYFLRIANIICQTWIYSITDSLY